MNPTLSPEQTAQARLYQARLDLIEAMEQSRGSSTTDAERALATIGRSMETARQAARIARMRTASRRMMADVGRLP